MLYAMLSTVARWLPVTCLCSVETQLGFCAGASFNLSYTAFLGKFWSLQKLGYFPLELCPKQSWQNRYLDLRFLKDIQMDCLWQTICILERQLLVSITQNQHSSYSLSSSSNTDESCHPGVWVFHDNAPAHKSLVAQQALCDCEFVQLNHPAYSPDLAPSDYFLVRNVK